MVLLGMHLAKGGGDALAWYGAQYPFEIVLTTIFTGLLRRRSGAAGGCSGGGPTGGGSCRSRSSASTGRAPATSRAGGTGLQMLQAVVLIGAVARLAALGLVVLSLNVLPAVASPVALIAEARYHSALSCNQRTALISTSSRSCSTPYSLRSSTRCSGCARPPSAATTPLTSDTSDGEAQLQRDSDRYLLREGRSTASTPERHHDIK